MIMKNFFITVLFIISYLELSAQSYYSDTIAYGSKVAYNVSTSGSVIYLRNRLTADAAYGKNGAVLTRNGRELKNIRMQYIWPQSYSEKRIKRQERKVFFKSFTKQEIGEMYSFVLWVDSNKEIIKKQKKLFSTDNTWCRFWVSHKGQPFEVIFISFPEVPPFVSFPPDRYYKFEQNVKKYIRYRIKNSHDMEQASRYLGSMYMIPPITQEINKPLVRLARKYGRDYSYLLE